MRRLFCTYDTSIYLYVHMMFNLNTLAFYAPVDRKSTQAPNSKWLENRLLGAAQANNI